MPQVLLRILEARGLAAGSPGATIDPYVIAKLGSEKKSTKAIKNSLTPFWDQDLTLTTSAPATDVLVIEIRDKDMLKDKTLGYVGVDLGELRKGATIERWEPLIAVPHGEIHFMITALDFDGVYHTAPGTARAPTYLYTSESGYRPAEYYSTTSTTQHPPSTAASAYPSEFGQHTHATKGYDPTVSGPFRGKTAPSGFTIGPNGGLVRSKSAAMGHLREAGREFMKSLGSLTSK